MVDHDQRDGNQTKVSEDNYGRHTEKGKLKSNLERYWEMRASKKGKPKNKRVILVVRIYCVILFVYAAIHFYLKFR